MIRPRWYAIPLATGVATATFFGCMYAAQCTAFLAAHASDVGALALMFSAAALVASLEERRDTARLNGSDETHLDGE